jgi:hypothetical protein
MCVLVLPAAVRGEEKLSDAILGASDKYPTTDQERIRFLEDSRTG